MRPQMNYYSGNICIQDFVRTVVVFELPVYSATRWYFSARNNDRDTIIV